MVGSEALVIPIWCPACDQGWVAQVRVQHTNESHPAGFCSILQMSMHIRDEVRRAVSDVGIDADELAADEAVAILSALGVRHATPGNRALWERLKVPGERDADGWMKAASFFEGELILLSDADPKPFGFRLAAADVGPLLEECFGFVFYLTDSSFSKLVCFNDHDVLIVSQLLSSAPS